jgi:Skp family chaperone for outer membrane proteins
MAAKNPGVMDKNFKKANRADDKLRNRKAGINTAIDKMTKEGTAKINELSPTTMQSYQKKADKASTKSFKKADDIEDKASDKGDDVWSSKSKASQKHSKMMGTGEKRAAGARLARKKLAKINELDKKTLGSYINKAADDVEYRAYALGAQEPTELGSVRKGRNRIKGIAKATDRLTKESVQEAAKPTGIHHPIDPTPGKEVNSKDAAGRAADIRASRNPLSMTEKEFVEMHQVPTTVDPAFDGNVAAKQTAENAKKAPIKQAKTPNTPTAMGDQKAVKSTEAPAANAGVVGESYMDKYAKYIRGEI